MIEQYPCQPKAAENDEEGDGGYHHTDNDLPEQ
jgi:hypothetical protein